MCFEADGQLAITEESPSPALNVGEHVSKLAVLIYSALSDVTKVTEISATVIKNELAGGFFPKGQIRRNLFWLLILFLC